MRHRRSVEEVVYAGLCTGCGTCVAICPKDAVCMEETPSGLLFAKIKKESCDSCGLCLRACGGGHLEPNLLPANVDPFKGEIIATYCGYATDSVIRLRGQSGGVATALLLYLLDTGAITKALVNRMPEDGTLRSEPFLASTKSELLDSQSSKYCPVALNAAIPHTIGRNGEKLAIVGLPCHIHSIRNAQCFHTKWKNGIGLTIGLFCDRILTFGAMDYLINKGKEKPKNVLTFRYKDKTQGEFPGSICFQTKNNKKIQIPSPERLAIKDYFTPIRCRLCFDKMNIMSDIAVGDAWGVKEDKAGFSVLLARTKAGLALLDNAKNAGYISLDIIEPDKVFLGQGVEARQSQWTAFSNIRLKDKEKLPDFQINFTRKKNNQDRLGKVITDKYHWSKINTAGIHSKKIIRSIKCRLLVSKIKRKFFSVLTQFFGKR